MTGHWEIEMRDKAWERFYTCVITLVIGLFIGALMIRWNWISAFLVWTLTSPNAVGAFIHYRRWRKLQAVVDERARTRSREFS